MNRGLSNVTQAADTRTSGVVAAPLANRVGHTTPGKLTSADILSTVILSHAAVSLFRYVDVLLATQVHFARLLSHVRRDRVELRLELRSSSKTI